MWPESIKVTQCTEVSRRVIIGTTSRNLKQIEDDLGAHRWDLNMRCFVMPFQDKAARGFLFSLQRINAFVEYSDPDWQTDISNKTTNGARNAGDSQIALTSVAGLEPYLMLNFANHPKLYMIESINGNTLTLNCPLQKGVPASTAVIFNQPKGTFVLPTELKRSADLPKRLRLELLEFNLRLNEAVGW